MLTDKQLFQRLLRRTCRYNKLVKITAPEDILRKEEDMLREVQAALVARGFDWKEWLESPQGQTALLLQEDQEVTHTAASERCGRCAHYCYDGEDYTCGKGIETESTLCQAFDDTEEDYAIRIQAYAFSRCSSCKKCVTTPFEVIEGVEYKCSTKSNMLAKVCSQFEASNSTSNKEDV